MYRERLVTTFDNWGTRENQGIKTQQLADDYDLTVRTGRNRSDGTSHSSLNKFLDRGRRVSPGSPPDFVDALPTTQ